MRVESDNGWQPYNQMSVILTRYQILHLHILYLWNNIAAVCRWAAAVL